MAKKNPTRSYKQMSDDLNVLIEWFESEEVNLEQAIEKYEQAMQLIDEMEDYLKTAQNKLKKITSKFSE
jgi:exodeoxyribonuclease VII small subunit